MRSQGTPGNMNMKGTRVDEHHSVTAEMKHRDSCSILFNTAKERKGPEFERKE